jgi:hypothetical protein
MLNTDKAVIRDNIGRLRLRQCKSKLKTERAISQWLVVKNRKTVGDILNKLHYNNLIHSVISPKA